MSLRRLALPVALACMAVSCTEVSVSPQDDTIQPDPPPEAPSIGSDESAGTPAAPPTRLPGRDYRRMDVDQLRAAIAQATGGRTWTETRGGRTYDRLQELESTLGKPDYIQSTIEDLSPALLFQKFLGDAAANVCDDLIREEGRAAMDERVFLVGVEATTSWEEDPIAVEANLRRQLLRFHGHDVEPEDDALDRWVWLHRTTEQVTGDPVRAWRTVCIGLITHPDFYTY